MARCAKCSSNSAFVDGGLCSICQQKAHEDAAKRSESEAQKRREHERFLSDLQNSGRSTSTSTSASTTTTTLSRPSSDVNKAAIAVIIILLMIAGFFGIRYMKYNSSEGGLYHHYEITDKLSDDSAAFVSGIIGRDNEYAEWNLSVTEKPAGYFANVFSFSDKTARVEHWTENGSEVFFYKFEGCDMGTGLSGRYYLTTVDGKQAIIDKSAKTIYPQGTAFYNEHYKALSEFTYDAVIPKLTEKIKGGEYGRNKDFNTTVLKTDKVSACVYDERCETRILDESGDVRLRYSVSFSSTNSSKLPDISAYKTAEK